MKRWIACMLPLRHNKEYYVKYQNVLLANPTNGLKYGEHQLEDIWKWVCRSQWTRQLQDPLHREEQETHFTLSMD